MLFIIYCIFMLYILSWILYNAIFNSNDLLVVSLVAKTPVNEIEILAVAERK